MSLRLWHLEQLKQRGVANNWASLVAQRVKNLTAMWETRV